MSDDDKKEQARVKAAQALRGIIDDSAANWPLRLELFGVLARDRKAQFDAYIKAGFDPAQALRLICAEIARPS